MEALRVCGGGGWGDSVVDVHQEVRATRGARGMDSAHDRGIVGGSHRAEEIIKCSLDVGKNQS